MLQMLQKSSIWRTLKVFFAEPTKAHYLRDICRKINLSPTSVRNNLAELESLGLIWQEKEQRGLRKFPFYKANINEKSFRLYKRINNLEDLLECGLVEFLEEKITPKAIVLFGSFQRGEDVDESDIDIFIESKEDKVDLAKFEKVLQRKIELHFKENFSSYPKELKNNIINGIVVSGFLEGFR